MSSSPSHSGSARDPQPRSPPRSWPGGAPSQSYWKPLKLLHRMDRLMIRGSLIAPRSARRDDAASLSFLCVKTTLIISTLKEADCQPANFAISGLSAELQQKHRKMVQGYENQCRAERYSARAWLVPLEALERKADFLDQRITREVARFASSSYAPYIQYARLRWTELLLKCVPYLFNSE